MKNNISVTASIHPEHKDVTLVSVKGFIDTNTAPEFDKVFQSILGEKKFNLVVDLKDVNYISSAGWGLFVGEIKRIRSQRGNLFLASMSPEVAEAYELLQFDTIIKSFPTVDQAVQKGFGKTLSKKGGDGRAASAAAASPEPQKGAAAVSAASLPDGVDEDVKKPGLFGKIFKPWKWF